MSYGYDSPLALETAEDGSYGPLVGVVDGHRDLSDGGPWIGG